MGGVANVVVSHGGDLHIFAWEVTDDSDTPIFDLVERQPVGSGAPISMLVDLVRGAPETRAIRVEAHRSVRLFGKQEVVAPA